MSDLESFGGFDAGGEGMDSASFEKFKERMRIAAQQLKLLQKAEKRRKQSEDELVRILLRFLKTGTNKDIMLLVSRLLEINVPAGFIVSVLLIAYKDIQEQLGIKLLPEGDLPVDEKGPGEETLPDSYIGGETLPLKVKIAIDTWVQEIDKRVSAEPERHIKTLLDPDDMVVLSARQLAAFCLRDYLAEEGVKTQYHKLKDFADFLLQGIMKKAKEQLKDQKELEG
ncbi:hypothetical protein ACFL2V_13330 [Pseudomonadota bacterium]